MKVFRRHQMVSSTLTKVLPHVNLFMWLVLFVTFNGNKANFAYDLNEQLDLDSAVSGQEELPLQISSPNIAPASVVSSSYDGAAIGQTAGQMADSVMEARSNNDNINNNLYQGNKGQLLKGKKLFSSAAEILQSVPPPIALANYFGTAFPTVSYPVLENPVRFPSHQMPSISSQQLNLLDRKKRSPGSRGSSKSSSYLTSLPLENVCESESSWVFKDQVVDSFGNLVRVLRRVDLNGTWVNQYFYENLCKHMPQETPGPQKSGTLGPQECRGIDKSRWKSECQQNYVWAHAKVASIDDEEEVTGWTWIPLSGSCSCGIRPNQDPLYARRKDHLYQKYCARFFNSINSQQKMSKCCKSNISDKIKVKI